MIRPEQHSKAGKMPGERKELSVFVEPFPTHGQEGPIRTEKDGPVKAFSFSKPSTWLATEKRSWLFLGILLLPLLHFVISKGRGLFFAELGPGIASLLGGWFIARSLRWNAFAERMGFFWKNNFRIAAVVILFMVMVLGLSPRAFHTNDDIAILLDIRGGFAVSFMSLILGRCLSLLYSLAPSFPFFGIILYFTHACSLYLFIKAFSRLKRFSAWFPFFLIAYLSFYAQFLMEVSYNNASFMIGINALMYCVSRLMEEERRTVVFMLSGLFFAFCFMVRKEALLGVPLFSAVIFAWLLIRDKRSWKGLVVFFIPVMFIFSADRLMARYGVSKTYKAYQRFNSLRGALHDYPILSRNRDNARLLMANGWTKNDMALFRNWFFPNERKFNETTMKNFFKEKRPGRDIRPKDVVSRTGYLIDEYHVQFFFLASLLILTVLLTRFKENKLMLLNVVYITAGMLAMTLVARFPHHIGDPLFLLPIESTVLFVFRGGANVEPRKPWNRPLYAFFIACCMAVLSLNGIGHARRAEYLISMLKEERAIMQRVNVEYSGSLFLASGQPWIQCIDPLRDSSDTFEIIPDGWETFSERFYDIIGRRVGVQQGYDLFPRFLGLKNAYVIGRKYSWWSIKLYLWENYRLRCKFVKVEMLNKSTGIFRVLDRTADRRTHRTSPNL
jgi:hypothetical protein